MESRIDEETRTETCPCCGKGNAISGIGMYDICRNCGWEDDPLQRKDPDYMGINGKLTLNEAKNMLDAGKTIYEGYPITK